MYERAIVSLDISLEIEFEKRVNHVMTSAAPRSYQRADGVTRISTGYLMSRVVSDNIAYHHY